jgi:anthranilate phosphoribosyltransferase
MAQVFADGGRLAMVVRGADGLDEVTVSGPTDVWDATAPGGRGRVLHGQVTPEQAGLAPAPAADLVGGDAAANAAIARAVLAGEAAGALGAVRTAVLLNAGLALVVWDAAIEAWDYGPATDAAGDRLRRAVPVAAESIDSGRAAGVLARWVTACG